MYGATYSTVQTVSCIYNFVNICSGVSGEGRCVNWYPLFVLCVFRQLVLPLLVSFFHSFRPL